MKGKILVAVVSMFLLNFTAFAKPSTVLQLKQANYEPVKWHATMQNGGFGIHNKTNKTQYVQVVIKSGEIYVYTVKNRQLGSCEQNLSADTGPYSIICELAPNDIIAADLDMSKMGEATGTYQVKM